MIDEKHMNVCMKFHLLNAFPLTLPLLIHTPPNKQHENERYGRNTLLHTSNSRTLKLTSNFQKLLEDWFKLSKQKKITNTRNQHVVVCLEIHNTYT